MNRDIKFRAWDRESKRLFNIARFDFADYTVYSHLFACEGYLGENLDIMQFTGLKDKAGTEIYEGDVIRFVNDIYEVFEPEVGTVIFDLEECGYKAQYLDGEGNTHCIYLIQPEVFADRSFKVSYEVIGNIYVNPNLLEESK